MSSALPTTDDPREPSQRHPTYKCDDCGALHPREDLLVKRAGWYEIGFKGKYVRTRAVKWQCRPCAEKDPDWVLEEGSTFIARGGKRTPLGGGDA